MQPWAALALLQPLTALALLQPRPSLKLDRRQALQVAALTISMPAAPALASISTVDSAVRILAAQQSVDLLLAKEDLETL